MPTKMVASVKEVMPNANIVQLSDMNTPIIKGVNTIIRKEYNGLIMVFRLEHLASLRGSWITLDTDMIIKKDLSHVFDQDFDVALTRRYGSILDTDGNDIVKIMPYNAGVMFSKNHEFWKDALEALKTFKQEAHEWYCDQLAIKFISDKNQYKVLELPCDEYNYTPGSKEERKDVYVYHFKGQRKDWMMNGKY
jgi:lipopolysaccharide biosynthesis glycosyltransferase